MARRKNRYDAACYYNGKRIGCCTTADSEAYTALMEQCDGSAARVLREYNYFSPELKAILEKVVVLQAKQTRREKPAGQFTEPTFSPWGEVQTCDTLYPGVFLVSTDSHGGIMISKEAATFLSPAAKKCGIRQEGYLCFEEDTEENVILRELLDKQLWKIPDRIQDKEAFEESINQSLREYNPAYWQARNRRKPLKQ